MLCAVDGCYYGGYQVSDLCCASKIIAALCKNGI